jgi:hypothetical protein
MALRLIRGNEGVPVTADASLWEILRSRLREGLGLVLRRIGIPGAISPMRYDDPITGDLMEVAVGPFYTRVTLNGRDYYFDRLSGRFNGTGQTAN